MVFSGRGHLKLAWIDFSRVWQVSVGLDVFRVVTWVSVDLEVFQWVWMGFNRVLSGGVSKDVDLPQLVCKGFSGKTTQHHLKPLKTTQNYTKPLKTTQNHPTIYQEQIKIKGISTMNNTIWSKQFARTKFQNENFIIHIAQCKLQNVKYAINLQSIWKPVVSKITSTGLYWYIFDYIKQGLRRTRKLRQCTNWKENLRICELAKASNKKNWSVQLVHPAGL